MTNTTSEQEKTYTQEQVTTIVAEAIRIAKSDARKPKEYSEYFVTTDGERMKWNSLSETKRFMETNYPEILTTGLTSSEFHKLLVEKMEL